MISPLLANIYLHLFDRVFLWFAVGPWESQHNWCDMPMTLLLILVRGRDGGDGTKSEADIGADGAKVERGKESGGGCAGRRTGLFWDLLFHVGEIQRRTG